MTTQILFITANRLGDAVLSTGLLAWLIHEYPGARVDIACGGVAASLFASVPGCRDVIVLKKRPYAGHWRDLWKHCRGRRYDVVVDLRNSLLSRLLWGRRKIIWSKPDTSLHKVEQLAKLVGIQPPPSPAYWPSDSSLQHAAALISAGAPILAVAPTANWIGKTWPIDRFIAAVEKLRAPGAPMAGWRVMVLAAPDEAAAAKPLLASLPADIAIDAIGKGNPHQVGALLGHCQYFLGNDSGLMHLAAAVGIPTAGLFGPSRVEHYGAWGSLALNIRTPESYDELVGRPGYDHRTTPSLMLGLTVDRVVSEITAHLNQLGQLP